MHQTVKGHWNPLYHKLHDIKIDGDKNRYFTITYANGLREILSHDGYETRLEQQNGWGVNFIYHRGTHLLQSVVDDEGNRITINRHQGYLDIISHKSDGQPAIIRIENHNSKPDKMTFLLASESVSPSIHLNYKGPLLTRVIYPTGLEKTFVFNCDDAMKFPSLLLSRFHSLCVVVAEETIPGAGQPAMKTHYLYSGANINGHNYLGFNSGLTTTTGNIKDTLFDAPVDYSYRTIKDNGLFKEIQTYNKYHLLIDTKLVSDHTGKTLSETENFFCNTEISDGCSQTSFTNLPITYSLPLKTINRSWGASSGPPAVSVTTKTYDHSGRIIRSTDAYGRMTLMKYCPVKGDSACPAVSASWPFSILPESVTLYPAPASSSVNISSLPFSSTYNFYRKQHNLHGSKYILTLDHQIYKAGYQRIILKRQYYKDRSNTLAYGLLKQIVKVNTTTTSSHAVIHNYRYTQDAKNHNRTTYISIELSPGKWQKLPSVVTSMFTNQIVERTGKGEQNKRLYHYDEFGRIVQTDLEAGTPFAVTLRYQYMLVPGHNQVIVTAVNGLQKKIVFDNAGRELMNFNEMISASGKAIPGHWQLKRSFRYDRYGRVIEQKSYIRDIADKVHILKTTKDYDDMGRVSHVYLPDKRIIFLLYDIPDHCMVSYQQSSQGERSPVRIVQNNLLDKPIKKRIIPASSAPLPPIELLCGFKEMAVNTAKTEVTTYDGWGHPVMLKDSMGRIVRTHYDALAHPDDITDPVGNHTHLVYNSTGQVTERWALPVSGGRYLLSSASYNNAGQLMYKAGEDGKKITFTYTETGKPATEVTSDGHLFSWRYNQIGLPVAKYIDGKIALQTDYDHITTKPIKKHDMTGITTWKYTIDGLAEQEVHSGENGYPDYKLSWNYNSDRHIASSSDIQGGMTYMRYDELGRLAILSYQPENGNIQVLCTTTYDAFSRINTIHYGSGMRRMIRYDNWSHQLQVTDTIADQVLSRWQFGYNANDNIIMLHQQTENHQEAVLNYQYDQLDNLISMQCNGSVNLPLCPRDTSFIGSGLSQAPVITSQSYRFTPLNRLLQVKEILQNTVIQKTLNKVVTYHYNNLKTPLRLQQTDTQWNQQVPTIRHIAYDHKGNMTIDGEGNHITYNIFNQITRVIKINGEQSQSSYDDSGLKRLEKSVSGQRYLFYNGNKLINEKIISSVNESHIIGYHGVARTIDGIIHDYAELNYKNDIVGILTKTTDSNHPYQLTQHNIYSPYGMVWHSQANLLTLPCRNLFGFDGERTDPVTGWQFLGMGERTYNPQQRYFVSEDPVGDGYAFASNNPIMKTDPSGNVSESVKKIFKLLRDIGTLGLGAIPVKGTIIAGALIVFGLSTLSLLVTIASYGHPWCAVLAGTGLGLLGLIPVASSAEPSNTGLNIAAAVIGVIQLAATITSAAFIVPKIYSCLSSCLCSAEQVADEVSASVHSFDSSSIENIAHDLAPENNIEMQEMTQTDAQLDVFERRIYLRFQHLISRRGDGLYLNIPNEVTIVATQSFFDSIAPVEESNIGTALAASYHSGRP
ncbi:MAG: RHS repeat-associated core domain-containing protein, partial [Endozoicomonadaceae bacterium]|nr:RHS repeat-associated core domain-containing protein [Endozoicomonadaceae bacterium]